MRAKPRDNDPCRAAPATAPRPEPAEKHGSRGFARVARSYSGLRSSSLLVSDSIRSIGSGNTIVELLSPAISVSVDR